MTVANGDAVRADLIGSWDGNTEIVQSYQFRLDQGGPLTDAAALADLESIIESVWDIIELFLNALSVMSRIKARHVPSGTLIGEVILSPPLVGVVAADVASTTVTAPLSFLTLVPRVILRKSFGPLLENGITADGEISSPTLTNLTNVAALLLADLVKANGTWRYGYYSPKTLGFVVPTAAVFSSAPGTMARRRLGRGS